jgi:hypothetical protein
MIKINKYILYAINAIMITIYLYCYILDPSNIGSNKWSIGPLAFICLFFLFKYLYKKSKEAGGYALLTTILLFIILYLVL